jgi:hypothetical protein
MTWAGWVLVGLAGGYLALALYGKYRKIRDEFHEAQIDEAERQAGPSSERGPEPGS